MSGKFIVTFPVAPIWFFGTSVKIIAPVLFTVEGENVTEQEVNVSAVKVIVLWKPPVLEVSAPMLPMNYPVSDAGLGFTMLPTTRVTLEMKVDVVTTPVAITLLPDSAHDVGVIEAPLLTDTEQVTEAKENPEGKVTVTVSVGWMADVA